MRRFLIPCFAVALALGCGPHLIRIEPGRPPGLHPNAPLSYWVWHDEGAWHLRTTTAGQRHHFHGWIEPVDGRIIDLNPSRVEWHDRVRLSPRGIEFDFETQGGIEGFDWHTSSGCNRFELRVDGRPDPRVIHLGGEGREPLEIPFARCR